MDDDNPVFGRDQSFVGQISQQPRERFGFDRGSRRNHVSRQLQTHDGIVVVRFADVIQQIAYQAIPRVMDREILDLTDSRVQMAPLAQAIADEQAMRDLLAYITSLD